MKTSEQIDQFAVAMLKAQATIRAVLKDKVGKVQSKTGASYEYRYSDLASVIEHVKPCLNDAGIFFMQGASGDAAGVAVETRLIHSSGQWAATTIYLPVNQGTAQAFGSAITYGKRYGLQAMCGLPSEDDDGREASEAVPAKPLSKPIPANVEGKDAFEKADAETKDMLAQTAATATRLVGEGKDGFAYLEALGFDHETYLAVWSQLDAKTRGKIKQQKPVALASQP